MAIAYVDGQQLNIPDAIRDDPQALAQYLARWREQQAAQRRQQEMSQPRQQQGGGMNPMQAYNIYSNFVAPNIGGGASAGAGAGASTGGGSAVSGLGGSFASGVGGGAGSGAGGALDGSAGGSAAGGATSGIGAAGPWAALAALIIANEKGGMDADARNPNRTQHMGDVLTGRIVEQDFHKRWLPKLFGGDRGGGDYKNDVTGFGGDTHALADFTTFDPKNALKTLKKSGSAAKLLKKIF